MLFWILLLVVIVSIIWASLDTDSCFAFVVSIFGSIILLISGFAIIADYTSKDALLAEYQMEREMLVYQYENNLYENDNDLGKYELMKDIKEWNVDLVYKQKIQKSFWVGIFFPNIYDKLEVIELEKGE